MLSDRAFMALIDLDGGARLNTVHTIGRELIGAGLAIDNFGFLELTEAGRRAARTRAVRRLIIESDQVADLSYRIDPMSNPMATPPPVTAYKEPEPEPEIVPAATIALEPPADETVRAYRAAGVATGKTAIEVDAKWVIAFVEAWVAQ